MDKFDDEVPQAQTGFLTQRYSTGPMMGDLATQSGVPTQGEVARQDQLRKEVEAAKQKKAARARYEAMPKIGPAKQRNYSEQVAAEEQRRRLNQQYADQNPEVTVDDSGDIVPSGYGRFMQTYGPNLDKFARSWETPLVIEGAISLAPLVGRGAVAAGEYFTTQTPLRNAYKLNPRGFDLEKYISENQLEARQIFGDAAFESFKKYGPSTQPGVSEMDQFLQMLKLPEAKVNIGRTNESLKLLDLSNKYEFPYFSKGSLWYKGPGKKYMLEEGPERIIVPKKGKDLNFVPAGEQDVVVNPEDYLPESVDYYAGRRRVLLPSPSTKGGYDPANFEVYEGTPHWWKGYKSVEVPELTSTQSITRGPINYWEDPKFIKNNPGFSHEDYVNSAEGVGKNSTDLPDNLKPILMDETGVITMEDALIKRLPPRVPTAEELALSERLKDRNKRVIEALKNRKQKKEEGGEIVKDNMGYWNPENWGKVVEIDSNDITMKGVNQPLIGVSDEGDVQYMEPGKDYKFKGKKVKEYPVAKKGISVNNADAQPLKKLDQLLNFTNYNKPTKGGWLDKYN